MLLCLQCEHPDMITKLGTEQYEDNDIGKTALIFSLYFYVDVHIATQAVVSLCNCAVMWSCR